MNYSSIVSQIRNVGSNNFFPISFVVCSDGTAYHIGQGLLLNGEDVSNAKLEDCPELVYHIRYSDDGSDIQIYGRGPGQDSTPTLRLSMPERDVIQCGFFTEDEYMEKLTERWPHIAKF